MEKPGEWVPEKNNTNHMEHPQLQQNRLHPQLRCRKCRSRHEYWSCPDRQPVCRAGLLKCPANKRIQFWGQSCDTESGPGFAARRDLPEPPILRARLGKLETVPRG